MPARESPRNTQPPTQSDPVAAAPPKAPLPKSCARIEKVIRLFPKLGANYHDNFDHCKLS